MGDAEVERAQLAGRDHGEGVGAQRPVLGELGLQDRDLVLGDDGGIGAEEELEDGRVAQLGQLVGRRAAPVLSAARPRSVIA